MNSSLVVGTIGKLSALLAIGLLGYFIGLRSSEGNGAAGLRESPAEIGCVVKPENNDVFANERSNNNSVGALVGKNNLGGDKTKAKSASPDNAVSSDYQDIEEQIKGALSLDESVVAQESERLPDAESESEPAEHIRTLTEDKQLKYVKALAENQDDASIVELRELITFDNETVRHAAVDTLIKIMDQETGHYDVVEAALADNAVFLDDGQRAKFNKIASRVEKRGAKENPPPAF